MIYLIKSPSYGDKPLLKIGYTDNLKKRINTYKTHNPQVELISSREGDQELEHFLHKFFIKYSYPGQPEWFYFDNYIIDNFSKVNLEDYISKETLTSVLNHQLLGKQNIKDLEDIYIEKYGKEDFQLWKDYLHRFWRNSDESLEFSLEGDLDMISINSIITIKDLPFELGSISFSLSRIIGQKPDSNSQKNVTELQYRMVFKKNDDRKKLSQALINKKIESTYSAIGLVEDAVNENYRKEAIRLNKLNIAVENYKSNYLSIAYKDGKEIFVPNNLVLISEQRAFDIQNVDYSDRFVMFNTIDSVLGTNTVSVGIEMNKFWNEYKKLTRKEDKLKLIYDSHLSEDALEQVKISVEMEIRNYLTLGLDRIKALSFDLSLLNSELKYKFSENDLIKKIYQEFKEGDKISKKELKERIKNIYTSIGINKIAKATDIETWFEIRRYQPRINGKKVDSFELIKKLK